MAIGEGDTLVLSIREWYRISAIRITNFSSGLASELLLDRYAVPDTANSKSLLARHELGIRDELRAALCTMANHRDADFDRAVLPRSLEFVSAMGQRMAYDAAVDANVDQCLIDLFVAACLKKDPAFYVEKAGISRSRQRKMEADAVDVVYERLEEFLEPMDLGPYITAPIISERKWNEYVDGIQAFGDMLSWDEPKATPSTRLHVDYSPYMQLTASAKL